MKCTTVIRAATRSVLALALLLTASAAGCGDPLGVPDNPTRIEDAELSDALGAELLRRGALQAQSSAVAWGALYSGVLADELITDGSFVSDLHLLDRRESELYEEQRAFIGDLVYGEWQVARQSASLALPKLEAHATPGVRGAHIGQMLALRAFAALRLAEYFCPGFPLHELVAYKVVISPPLSTEQALENALAGFDSALVYATDSARILNFARVGRGRTLLNLGRYAEAAVAVAGVPTAFVYSAEYSDATMQPNQLNATMWFGISVSDREGGTGLDYVSANDPRVQLTSLGEGEDGVTPLYGVGKYPTTEAPIVIASGIEARVIEAEAALKAGDPKWLIILNELRATEITPPLDPLTDPGSLTARVDLVFGERAFWLFATGSRLGDLRRLIRLYGRSSENVFPTGTHRLGGLYGSATSIPFVARLETPSNPAVTGCMAR